MKIVNLLILALGLMSCASSKMVPPYDQMNQYPYGAQISISPDGFFSIRGELLAVSDSFIWVLKNQEEYINLSPNHNTQKHLVKRGKNLYGVDRNYYHHYQIQVGRGTNYQKYVWGSFLTLAHGVWSIFTLPINLIVTSSINKSAKNAYAYDNFEVNVDHLYQYARFPAGLPENLNERDLLSSYPLPVQEQSFPTSIYQPSAKNKKAHRPKKKKRGNLE